MDPLWPTRPVYGSIVYPDRVGLTVGLTIRRISDLNDRVIVATVPDDADSRTLLILRENGFVVDMGCYAFITPPPPKMKVEAYNDCQIMARLDWLRRLDEQFGSLNRDFPKHLADEEMALHAEQYFRHQSGHA